jgi:hypothetical protein
MEGALGTLMNVIPTTRPRLGGDLLKVSMETISASTGRGKFKVRVSGFATPGTPPTPPHHGDLGLLQLSPSPGPLTTGYQNPNV